LRFFQGDRLLGGVANPPSLVGLGGVVTRPVSMARRFAPGY
jgi:hypothetical protein